MLTHFSARKASPLTCKKTCMKLSSIYVLMVCISDENKRKNEACHHLNTNPYIAEVTAGTEVRGT